MHDSEVRLAFFKEVGQQEDFQAVMEHDLVGANARALRIDQRRARENPGEALRRPAMRMATAILMYSFGGLRREGWSEGETLPPGITEPELLSVCVGPDLDSTTAQACLKELREQCLYLHFDGARYCFKKDPNVTLLIEQEADIVGRDDKRVGDAIEQMIEQRVAGHRNAVVWPKESGAIEDNDPQFLIVYLPLGFSGKPRAEQEAIARDLLEKCGDRPRNFRNGLGLAIPANEQVEILRRAVRYLLAAEGVRGKARQLNLTDEQRAQLREREATETAAAESALLKLYTEVWLPRAAAGGIALERVAPGGKPLQTTLDDKKRAKIHGRMEELITQVYRKVFDRTEPGKIVELFKFGEGNPPQLGIATSEVVDGFFSFIGFPRLLNAAAIRKGITKGVLERHFGYVAGPKLTLSTTGKFEVAPNRVRFDGVLAEDEIDLESGFLMLPQAIPPVVPVAGSAPSTAAPGGGASFPLPPGPGGMGMAGGGPTSPVTLPSPAPPGTAVDLTFTADRNSLYVAWNAIANLADLAGKLTVSIHAESERGFDQTKLQNGVMEPLREANLIE